MTTLSPTSEPDASDASDAPAPDGPSRGRRAEAVAASAGGAGLDREGLDDDGPPVRIDRKVLIRTSVLVLLAMVVGFAIRWYAVTVAYPTCPVNNVRTGYCIEDIGWGDAFYYNTQAQLLADGHGFVNPTANFQAAFRPGIDPYLPGAGHPPVYTVFLAGLDSIGMTRIDTHRKVEVFVGVLGIALIAMAAWQVAGRRREVVAPVAALLAATYPMLWINDFRYLSESIYIPIVAVLIMACYRFWRRGTWPSAILLGAMIGLAGLTRGEGIFLLGFTLPFLLLGMRHLAVRKRLALGAVVGVTALGVLAPWVLYNLGRFSQPVTITSGTGMVLVHGSCDDAYYGQAIGYYSFTCANTLTSIDQDPRIIAEEVADAEARAIAVDYIKANSDQLPVVMLARAGRMWDVYDPIGNVQVNALLEGRGEVPSRLGLWFYALLVPFGLLGVIDLRRRSIPLSPIVGLAAAVTLTAMLSFGITRYRVPADVALVIAGAIGIDIAVRRARAWARNR